VSSTAIRWRFTPATTRPVRLLLYAAVGLTVGPWLALVGLVGATLVAGGGVGAALLAFVLALVVGVGVGSGRAVFALGKAPSGVHETVSALSRWGVVASIGVGAGVCLAGLLWTDVGFTLLVASVVVGFGCLAVSAGLRTNGVVDSDTRALSYAGHTIPLDAVRRLRTWRLDPFVFALVTYYRGRVGPSTPRWLVFSEEAHDAIESVRATTDERDADDSGETEPRDTTAAPSAVRWVAAAFGVGCLLAGPVLWLVVPPEGRLFVGYLGVFGLLFGALFVRYALVA
jgi:hypothetical protein